MLTVSKCNALHKCPRKTCVESLLMVLKLLTSLFSCDNYTGAVMQRSITVLPKYLVLHRSEAQPVELSFVITIQDVSILALIHITPHISLLFI